MDCSNYRGISLLDIVGKVFARVVLSRLKSYVTVSIVTPNVDFVKVARR